MSGGMCSASTISLPAHRARYVLASTSKVYGDPEIHPLKRMITWFREQLLNLLHLVAEGA